MFSPITKNMEERLKLIKESMSKEIATEELQKCESLEDFYWFSKKVKNGIVAQMQLYVLKNFKNVPLNVWNKGSFKLMPHTGKKWMRFGKEDEYVSKQNDVLDKIFKDIHDKSVKIESIDFVLDEMDGDFSVNFNEGTWSFLWEDDIVDYYYTIKNYLDEQ